MLLVVDCWLCGWLAAQGERLTSQRDTLQLVHVDMASGDLATLAADES